MRFRNGERPPPQFADDDLSIEPPTKALANGFNDKVVQAQGAGLRPLRPHQARAIEELRASLASGKRRPMLQAPTGFGKTLTAAHIIQRLSKVRELQGDLVELGARQSGRRDSPSGSGAGSIAELLGLAEERRYARGLGLAPI